MITIGLSQILRADGRPKTATASTIIGCIELYSDTLGMSEFGYFTFKKMKKGV
jgi:hypothetical protein